MSSIDENQGIAPNDWSGAADAARKAKDRQYTAMIAGALELSSKMAKDAQERTIKRRANGDEIDPSDWTKVRLNR